MELAELHTLDPDQVLLAAKAARLVGAAPSTICRWSRCGLRNDYTGELVRLHTLRVGRRLATTPNALLQFFAALGAREESAA